MTAGLPLLKNVITTLAKSVFIPLGVTVGASATDADILKKKIINQKQLLQFKMKKWKNIIKIVKLLEESALKRKQVSETIKNEAKQPKDRFHSMLLETLAASI